jgi:hypothetical protein
MIKDKAPRLRGWVRLQNEAGLVVESHNLVVYTGGDIIAGALAGLTGYYINYMYFGYENTAGVPAPPAAARTDTVATFVAYTAPKDYLRTPTLVPPVISTSDVNHNGNVVTFSAIATATVGVNGLAFNAGVNSKVFDVGLVCSPTGLIASDILYAHFILPTALPAVGGGQVSATWATEAD